MIRRGFLLYLYTGQRGSDVVTLGPTMVDEGGFSLVQKKTGREVWCPILPELAVVNLRRSGLSTAQISDCIGMSIAMIERYCRFADKKANGKAALINLSERAANRIVKQVKNSKAPT